MKLNISSAGIYDPVKNELNDCLSTIREATNSCMKSPGTFSCSSYVNNLSTKLNSYVRVCNTLMNSIKRVEDKYDSFLADEKRKISNLSESNLKERTGLNTRFNDASQKYVVDGKVILDSLSMLIFNSIAKPQEASDLNGKDDSSQVEQDLANRASRDSNFSSSVGSSVSSGSSVDTTNVDTSEVGTDTVNQVSVETSDNVTIDDESIPNTMNIISDAPTESTYTGPVLTKKMGRITGPSGEETYYNLNMSKVVQNMKDNGYEGEYWVREDGVKMFGDYVIVAANLDVHPRGSIVETSLGKAIVCDTGEFAKTNSTQLDIAVTW
jgi:hypothetical protein